MTIRPAIKEDIIHIRLLLERNFDEVMSQYHSKEILEKFKAHNTCDDLISQLSWKRVYIAEYNGQIVATGSLANFGAAETPKYSVSNLYVLPEFHNKGIGTSLITKLIGDAMEADAPKLHVPSSRNAVGFYKTFGFEPDSEQPDKSDEITWMTMPINYGHMDIQHLEIKYLCDNLHFADTVSSWIYNEFIKGVRGDLTLNDITVRISKCNIDALPVRLVAVLDGKCVGTVSLVENDLKCRDYTPWLAALYVDRDCRGCGIAKMLIAFTQETAKRLGYKELYLRTEHASGYYKNLGWQFVEKCSDDFGLEPEVFKYTF